MRIGILGGTFDPVHIAHLLSAREAAEAARLDKVVFMPAGIQPFKQDQRISPAKDRVDMLRAVTKDNPLFEVTEVETRREGVSYTIDSLESIKAGYGRDDDIFFILGADMFVMLEKWHRAEELLRGYSFVVLHRPGTGDDMLARCKKRYETEYATTVISVANTRFDVSSSLIRRRVSEGRDIAYLVPRYVHSYILEHGLYRATE